MTDHLVNAKLDGACDPRKRIVGRNITVEVVVIVVVVVDSSIVVAVVVVQI